MMHVLSLQLCDFRTYKEAEARLGPGVTVVHGENGVGKSNLLEALCVGCTGRSPRTRNDREMVRFGAHSARVTTLVANGGPPREITIDLQPGQPKRLAANGVRLDRLGDIGYQPAVRVFSPDRLDLLKGPPSVRRAYLDSVVAGMWPSRAATRLGYSRVLSRRNAAISAVRSGRTSRGAVERLDLEMARYSIALTRNRRDAAASLASRFTEQAHALGFTASVALEYRPCSPTTDPEQLAREMRAHTEIDLRQGISTYGAHRDELHILRDGRDLRAFGSQGEQRVATLGVLLTERAVLARERGTVPLMLLDDVMSELDQDRSRMLLTEVSHAGQCVIATADPARVLTEDAHGAAVLRVGDGTVTREE